MSLIQHMAIQWRQTLFLVPILFCSLLSCSGTGGEGGAPSISPTADTAPPAVVAVFPGKDATGVSLTPAVTATFSKVMDASSLTATTFTVKDAQGNLIPGTISHTGTTATFIPSVALAPSSSYLATITAGVIDLARNALPNDYFWPFATGTVPDTTPPTVIATTPTNGATGVPVNTTVTVTFSEVMDASSLNATTFTVKDGANNPVSGVISYSSTTVSFTPSSNLVFSTTYTATITTGAKDLAGNALPTNYSWNFATGVAPDTTPPTVISTTPVNGATDVAANATLAATFSEVMDATTITAATFTVKDAANSPVSGVISYSSTTATFTPSSNLAFSTTYTATITTGAKDLAGNNLVGNYAWTFITGASPSLPSGSLVPEFGSGGVVTVNPGNYVDKAFDVLIADNALFVVGSDERPGPQWHIEKRNLTTGALVTAFGAGGVVSFNPSSGYDTATRIVSDGTHLFVVGDDMVPAFGDYEWRIEKRLLSTGELVTAFGNNGVVTVNPHSGGGQDADVPNSVAIDGTSLYVSGIGNLQLRIEKRSLNTGELDTNFGTGGVLTSTDMSNLALIQARDSFLFVIGTMTTPSGYRCWWRIEKRSLSTGEFITDFGTNGVVTSDLFCGEPYAATTDGNNLYVVGYGSAGGGSPEKRWVIEKRSLSTGDLVTTFGTGGVIYSSTPSDMLYDPWAYDLVIDGGNLYVVGPDVSLGPNLSNLQWRIEKRSLSSGAFIEDFGSGGVVTSNPSNSSDDPYAVVTDATSLYVVGADSVPGNIEWRIEKRAK